MYTTIPFISIWQQMPESARDHSLELETSIRFCYCLGRGCVRASWHLWIRDHVRSRYNLTKVEHSLRCWHLPCSSERTSVEVSDEKCFEPRFPNVLLGYSPPSLGRGDDGFVDTDLHKCWHHQSCVCVRAGGEKLGCCRWIDIFRSIFIQRFLLGDIQTVYYASYSVLV